MRLGMTITANSTAGDRARPPVVRTACRGWGGQQSAAPPNGLPPGLLSSKVTASEAVMRGKGPWCALSRANRLAGRNLLPTVVFGRVRGHQNVFPG